MRPWVPLVLAFAAFAAAQGSSSNIINNPAAGIQAQAGQPLTLTWSNPSSGTVTVKIQTSGDILPTDGIVVAENIPNTGSATFTIPADVPIGEVYVQIIDDTNPSEYNFSAGFQVQGATNTATAAAATTTTAASASASSASGSASGSSASDSASMTTTMSTVSSSGSSATNVSNSTLGSSATSARSTPSASRTSASPSANAQGTTAPSNAAMPMQVQFQGGLLAAAVWGAAALL